MKCRILDYYDGPQVGVTTIDDCIYIIVSVMYKNYDCYLFEVDDQTYQQFLKAEITLLQAIKTTNKWGLAEGFEEGLPLYNIVWVPERPVFKRLLPNPKYKLPNPTKIKK